MLTHVFVCGDNVAKCNIGQWFNQLKYSNKSNPTGGQGWEKLMSFN